MKKDILLAVISEVIDKGARIIINYGQYHKPDFTEVTKQEAFALTQMVSDAVGTEVEEWEHQTLKEVGYFTVNHKDIRFTAGYIKHMEEDVNLTGSDFDDREAI